jgi:hypothetical protein
MFETENGDTPFMDHSTVDILQKAGDENFFSSLSFWSTPYGLRSKLRSMKATGNLMLKFAS